MASVPGSTLTHDRSTCVLSAGDFNDTIEATAGREDRLSVRLGVGNVHRHRSQCFRSDVDLAHCLKESKIKGVALDLELSAPTEMTVEHPLLPKARSLLHEWVQTES